MRTLKKSISSVLSKNKKEKKAKLGKFFSINDFCSEQNEIFSLERTLSTQKIASFKMCSFMITDIKLSLIEGIPIITRNFKDVILDEYLFKICCKYKLNFFLQVNYIKYCPEMFFYFFINFNCKN